MARPARKLNAERLWEYALRNLGGRACSTGELRQKLRVKCESAEDVDTTISRLKDSGYLDDRRFAEHFASARLENQKMGKMRVLRDLQRRRVAPALATLAVQKTYQDIDETQLIEDFIRRRLRQRNAFQEDKDFMSAYGKLLRAGFQSGAVIKTLKKFAKNPELLDNLEPPESSLDEESPA